MIRPSTPDPALESNAPAAEGIDLRQAAGTLRRRWWLVALCGLATLSVAWFIEAKAIDRYTAQALISKEVYRSSPLSDLQLPLPGVNNLDAAIGTQIEVIRSNAVLAPVVNALGLRLVIAEPVTGRSEYFRSVEVAPNAPQNAYRIEAQGREMVLLDARSDERLASAAPGSVLAGPGFEVVLSASIDELAPVELHVVHGESAVRRLRRDLSVQQVERTSLVRLSYTDPDPQLVTDVVSEVARSYQEHDAVSARTEAGQRREFLARQLATVADSLESAQIDQLSFQERSGTLDPQTEGEALIGALMQAESEVRLRRYQESMVTTLNRSLSVEGEADEALRRTVSLGDDVLPGAEGMYSRLQDLQEQRSRLTSSRFGYTSSGSEVEVLDSLISETKQEIRAITQQALEVISSRRVAAESRVMELQNDVRSLPGRSTGFYRLKQRADAIQGTFDLLAEKYYEAQIAEAMEGGEVNIVDPPTVPVMPNPSNKPRNLALALLLGLLLGTGLAVAAEYFDRKVHTREQAEEATGAPVLVTVPRIRVDNGGDTRPILLTSQRNSASEAFRSLRTMLRFSKTGNIGVIAVTSAEPGEGKSVVASNLAVTMASDYPRVLLIDADFPRPVQHSSFEIRRSPGLADLLAGDATAEEVVHYDEERRLHLIPAGSRMPNSAELLVSPQFRQFMSRVARDYDVVVVDTPPVLAVADTMALSTVTEATLLVAREGVTDRRALRHAAQKIRSVGGSIAGVVLNDSSPKGDYSSYYDTGKDMPASNGGGRPFGTRIRDMLGVGR